MRFNKEKDWLVVTANQLPDKDLHNSWDHYTYLVHESYSAEPFDVSPLELLPIREDSKSSIDKSVTIVNFIETGVDILCCPFMMVLNKACKIAKRLFSTRAKIWLFWKIFWIVCAIVMVVAIYVYDYIKY